MTKLGESSVTMKLITEYKDYAVYLDSETWIKISMTDEDFIQFFDFEVFYYETEDGRSRAINTGLICMVEEL